jgi:hypothetical protein
MLIFALFEVTFSRCKRNANACCPHGMIKIALLVAAIFIVTTDVTDGGTFR